MVWIFTLIGVLMLLVLSVLGGRDLVALVRMSRKIEIFTK